MGGKNSLSFKLPLQKAGESPDPEISPGVVFNVHAGAKEWRLGCVQVGAFEFDYLIKLYLKDYTQNMHDTHAMSGFEVQWNGPHYPGIPVFGTLTSRDELTDFVKHSAPRPRQRMGFSSVCPFTDTSMCTVSFTRVGEPWWEVPAHKSSADSIMDAWACWGGQFYMLHCILI